MINLKSQGLAIILSSPSGGGKSSLALALLQTQDKLINPALQLSISVTTRAPRVQEVEGVDYYFKSVAEFEQLIRNNDLLEYTEIYGNYYGTIATTALSSLASGANLLFDIDSRGAAAIKNKLPRHAVSIFILPPSLGILKSRLEQRAQNSSEDAELRLKSAAEEMQQAVNYDYVIINDDFNTALQQLRAIISAEQLKTTRLDKLNDYLQKK